jgi:hypothetical protein
MLAVNQQLHQDLMQYKLADRSTQVAFTAVSEAADQRFQMA